MAGGDTRAGWDFFLSYTRADQAWAEWIAWILEEDGYRVLVQAWDFVPGTNWILEMQTGIDRSPRTIAVLSPAYLASVYGSAEWQAAWAVDPAGSWRKLLVVRVADCPRPGLLAGVVGVDLFGLDDAGATAQLRAMIAAAVSGRAKPAVKPSFPGAGRTVPHEPQFPGPREPAISPSGRRPHKDIDEAASFAANRKAVMVIHGRDIRARKAVLDWLRDIGLQPLDWAQLVSASGSAALSIGDIIDRAFKAAQAVVALLTPDEYVTSATSLDDRTWRAQAETDVLIAAGMALIAQPSRTIIVTIGRQSLPGSLAGPRHIRLTSMSVVPLHDFAERLRLAGCETNTSGVDWLNPARFPHLNTH